MIRLTPTETRRRGVAGYERGQGPHGGPRRGRDSQDRERRPGAGGSRSATRCRPRPAFEPLRAARTAGIEVRIEGDYLFLEAPALPPAQILEVLARHKPGIVALLRPGADGWSAEDWQVFFDERAGISEFDGGLPRPEAEASAFACCVVEWLNRNPVRSPPGRCLACGAGDHAHDPLVPFGTETAGHVWLHSRCWPAWYAGRKAEAVAALAAMKIATCETLTMTAQGAAAG